MNWKIYNKDIIDSRLDSDNVLINEHGGRELLYLYIGTKPLCIVSGRPYFPNFTILCSTCTKTSKCLKIGLFKNKHLNSINIV